MGNLNGVPILELPADTTLVIDRPDEAKLPKQAESKPHGPTN